MDQSIEIEPAAREDLPGIAGVFVSAFDESMRHLFGATEPPRRLISDLFEVCLTAEPAAFLVARGVSGLDEGRILGYIFAPSDIHRIWRTFVTQGFAVRWARDFCLGRLGVGWPALRKIVANKAAFLLGAHPAGAKGRARVLSLAVHPDAQGQGVATRLLEAGLWYLGAEGARAVVLEVRPWNTPALHLYRKFGFRMIGETRDTQGAWFVMVREGGGR